MKFNFFVISYTVIYAKYNHCFEIPKDMPLRYFDGKEWKFMKPRHNFRMKAPRYTHISTEIDWADLIKEIELQETTTQMPPACGRTKTKTTTTLKTTTTITTTATTKAAVQHSPPRCKSKLKTTTTIDPRIWQMKMKMLASEDWTNAWTRVRPTKKLCPVGQGFWVDPSHCKLKLETTTTTTTIEPLIWQMKMVTSKDWIKTWTRVRPTKKPFKITTNLPVTSTKKCATTTKEPVTITEKPVELSETQVDDVNGPENWSNLMKEFLKFVESKKCRPPREFGTTTTMPFSRYMIGDRSGADDLTNILINGVEIDDRLSEVDDNASQNTAIMRFKETNEADREQRLNYYSAEGSVSQINNDNVQDIDLKSFKDSAEVRRIKQDVEENAQYLEKDSETKAYLHTENARHIGKAQDKDTRKRLNAIKDVHSTPRYEDNSQYVSKNPLNFKELNRNADYVVTKRTYFTDSTEMRTDNEDFLQDRDITFDLGTLEGDHEKAGKYSTESIEVRDSDVYAYADTIHDMNEQKDDKTTISYENVIP